MPKSPKVFGKFKLLSGVHAEGGRIYYKGDTIESASDLLKHNTPGRPRFASLEESVPSAEPSKGDDSGLEEMTYAELKSYAEEGEIDITGASSKSQLIDRIKAAAD